MNKISYVFVLIFVVCLIFFSVMYLLDTERVEFDNCVEEYKMCFNYLRDVCDCFEKYVECEFNDDSIVVGCYETVDLNVTEINNYIEGSEGEIWNDT